MRFRPPFDFMESSKSGTASCLFWTFEPSPSVLHFLWYWGGAAACALLIHWLTGLSWLITIPLLGVPAAGLFFALKPIWEGLTLALRHRLALSRVRPGRTLAGCPALLVACHRRANGSVVFAGVMGIEALLELSPVARHQRIRDVVRSLRCEGPTQSEQEWGETYSKVLTSASRDLQAHVAASSQFLDASQYELALELVMGDCERLLAKGLGAKVLELLEPFTRPASGGLISIGATATLWGTIGLAHYALGYMARALDYFERALLAQRAIGDRSGEAKTLSSLGRTYSALRRERKAIRYFKKAVKIQRAINDRDLPATLGELGLAYSAFGKMKQAACWLEAAVKVSREIGDRWAERVQLVNLGLFRLSLRQHETALSLLHRALEMARVAGDRSDEAMSLGAVGDAHRALKQPDKAIACYEEALKIRGELGDLSGQAKELNRLVQACRESDQLQRTHAYLLQALETRRRVEERRRMLWWAIAKLKTLPT